MRLLDQAQQAVSLVVCLLVVASLAVVRHGELLGHEFGAKAATTPTAIDNDTLRTLADGTMVVNTTRLGSDIVGYAGPVPLEISLKDGVVTDVRTLDNAETKDFFDQAATLLGKWRGKTIDEAASMEVDAVSGATFSSKAIIGNMRRGLSYAQTAIGGAAKSEAGGADVLSAIDLSAKGVAGLVVVLMAAVLPLFVKNRVYRTCQLALNVIVLGFWCGAFLSYTSLLGYAAHGLKSMTLVAAVMLATAFVYPLFGRRLHYCTHVCPFGSLQQLAGKCGVHKLKMSQSAVRRLDQLRQLLWALLMLCVWGGVWTDWMDYEAFAAFIFQSASWVAVAIAAVFLLLSFVVARPYCRFVCPMGTLMAMSQSRGGKRPRR